MGMREMQQFRKRKAEQRKQENKDAHTENCCKTCGCKYGDSDCSVRTGVRQQSFKCGDAYMRCCIAGNSSFPV